ncbi:AzlD domain-containing protein [Rhodococcus sp. G-MC3]|uniref:branched-chain amino acid transporter permease n=1 Tax=Rhodococcus sp. G-MC3 TaxID=3046209 RepID=UPI0024B88471|nr:AzlD domain-containing protein [Rhodococcus sp. G-MC3]MDJ0393592.1 AzlD domain-containing protein [Rhodococcus sp. G-MC3]
MTDYVYVAGALAAAVGITFALRAIPFAVRSRLRESALLDAIGGWMPLGAVAVLAIYALSSIDLLSAHHGVPQIAGVAATVGTHLLRRNAALSILVGTATCVLLENWIL